MKAGVLERIEQLAVKEVPDPRLGVGSVIIRVKACSVCTTDLRIYHHGHPRVKLPHVLGHEIAGEIVAVDGEVTLHKVGDRVAIAPRITCGDCAYCRRGQPIYCQNSVSFGHQLPGGFAEYVLVPWRGVQLGVINNVADSLSFEEATVAETLACCVRGQRTALVGQDDTVAVVGGGPVGILHCRLARANGAGRVILVERDLTRLEAVDLAPVDEVVDSTIGDPKERVLALSQGIGADVVIVACSSPQAQQDSLSLAAKGGRVNFFGGLLPEQSNISIDSNVIHYDGISLGGSHGCTPEDHRQALELLGTKAVKVDDLITKRFPLDQIGEAFAYAESKRGMHAVIILSEETKNSPLR